MVRTYNHQKNASSLGAMFGGVEGVSQTQKQVRELSKVFNCVFQSFGYYALHIKPNVNFVEVKTGQLSRN